MVGPGLVVAGQTSVQHQPAEAAFHHPPALDRGEALCLGVTRGDVQADAEPGGVFDGAGLEAGVGPCCGQVRVGGLGLVQQSNADGVVGGRGGGDDDGQDEAEGVGDDAALAADDLLAGVDALGVGGCVVRGLHGLRVDDAGGGLGLAAGGGAGQAGQLDLQLLEDSLSGPGGEVAVDGHRWWEVVGQVAPGDAGAVDVQDGVDDVAQVVLGRSASDPGLGPGLAPGGQGRCDQSPAGVG